MHINLINPPSPHLKQPGAQVPLGILYIAAQLKIFNYSVEVLNLSFYIKEIAIDLVEKADVYGITCTSMQLLEAGRFAKLIKEKFPLAKVILGGPGTITPEYVDWRYVDAIVEKEGEYAFLKVLDDIQKGRLKEYYVGKSIQNLSVLPIPSRDLIRHQGGDIFAYGKKYDEGQSTQILTSRGCPFSCAFCAAKKLNKGVRFRDLRSIEDELIDITQNYGIHQLRVADENFFTDRKRCFSLIELFAKYNIKFRISTRVKPLDEELWRTAKEGGLKEFSFGVESFDDAVLKGLNKKATALDSIKALELAHRLGISSRVLLMIRTPFQTRETVRLNIEALKKVPFNIIACTHFLPLPGCDIWYKPDKYRIQIVDRNLDHYNFYGYGPEGRRHILKIFEYIDRDTTEVNRESEDFLTYLEESGKVNKG